MDKSGQSCDIEETADSRPFIIDINLVNRNRTVLMDEYITVSGNCLTCKDFDTCSSGAYKTRNPCICAGHYRDIIPRINSAVYHDLSARTERHIITKDRR